MKRTLSLKSETLAALDAADLAGIHGGAISDPHIACRYVEPNSAICTFQPTRCLCP